MAKYVFPAVFTEEGNDQYSVHFPDVNGCYTCGDSLVDAMEMAEDALTMMLAGAEKDGSSIPDATPIRQVAVDDGSFVTLILCDTEGYEVTECEATIRIKNARENSSLTIAQLSQQSGVPADVIESIESQEWGTVVNAIKLAKALHVELSEICEQVTAYDE
ncbi:MAG: type II toxin-antitoxin system HicB family antitoxin [Oscillospiraceae bacterium]|nr:type II toxin-antitoxin system HicB family antitoxin [Oscillospiraceae bacterium]